VAVAAPLPEETAIAGTAKQLTREETKGDVSAEMTMSGVAEIHSDGDEDDDPDGTIGKKRRGIRLKQDLN
jgi:hypothetical protein